MTPLQQKLFQKSVSSTVDPYSVLYEAITETHYNNVSQSKSANYSMNASAPFSLDMSNSKDHTFHSEFSDQASADSSEISFDDLQQFFPKIGKN